MKKQANNSSGWKQGLLIALIVVFSLILIADLGIRAFVPEPYANIPSFSQRSGRTGEKEARPQRDRDGETFPAPGSADFRPAGQNAVPAPLSTLRSAWLPIAAVCILAILVCSMLLIRFRKLHPAEEDTAEDEFDEPPHRGGNQGFLLAALCIVLAGVMIITSLPTAAQDSSSVNTRILSGTPENTVISTVLSGAGTLTNRESDPITAPSVVDVDAYHVHNGDMVSSGDILASVDKVTVSSAIAELQDVLDELNKDLKSAADKNPDSSISSPAAGRIMKIYVQKDDSISDVMYDSGALMLLSLDGTLAADIRTDADITIGDTAVVTLPDGSTADGRITAYSDGIAAVTIPDDAAALYDTITATAADGTVLGSGKLYIHSELKITGYYGTVANVNVSEGAKVTAGRQLITLKDTGHTADYTTLLDRRYELEAQMVSLFALAQDGFVRADKDGIVAGIPADADFRELPAEVGIAATAADSGSAAVHLLTARRGQPLRVTLLSKTEQKNDTLTATVVSVEDGILTIEADADELNALFGFAVGNTLSFPYDGDVDFFVDGKKTTGTVDDLQPGDIITIEFGKDILGMPTVESIVCAPEEEAEPDPTEAPTEPADSDEPTKPTKPTKPGDDTGSDDEDAGEDTDPTTPSIPSRFPSISIPSGLLGGMTAQKKEPVYNTYDASNQDVVTVIPRDDMTVTIQIDELDVLALQTGLDAQVTLDALKGQIFGGTITRIDTIGTNEGGNTKYAVEVTLPRTAQMLDGMNASVKIVTATTDIVRTVPAAALVEQGARTYVYTAYDEKNDTLAGLTEVTTGVSDGKNVEILSGLSDSDTYYYRYADAIEYEFVR